MSDFVHLHVHTQYSLLDGFSDIPKLVKRAKDLEMPALGITDHGTMFGVIDFFKAAKAAEIKPIIGIEAYLAARKMKDKDPQKDRQSSHLLLLAENQAGYQNLLKIASAAQLEGFYYYPRIDKAFLAAHSEGLICTSGCMSAEVPRALLRDNPEKARKRLDWYYEVFGPDNFYIELQSHDIPEIPRLNRQLMELGERYKGKFIATNDVHYVNPEDAYLQDIMLCVQTSSLYNDPKRMKMSDESFYLKTQAEMAALFADVPGALSNTLAIAERCQVNLSTEGYHLPDFEVPDGYTVRSYLEELCDLGLHLRFGENDHDAVIRERLEYELGIIDQMGFNAYFLIVWDLCRRARELGIWYNARGSASGSIVAYALEITLVDPIEHGLIFERFLNPGRVSMPDIDLDFQDDRRYELMEYCAQKYGDDKVAAIITFGKLKARAAVRDVGRVLDIPLNEVDRVAKLIPNIPGNAATISEALEQVPDFAEEYNTKPYIRNLIDTAMRIEGAIRNAGTHAAGVVVTDRPVVEYIPLHRPTGANVEDTPIKTVTQFEMQTIDSLGLLKVDFLGLSTLTIMQRACELIKARHGVNLNLYNIPLDDEATYEMLGRGETAGVFQLEGGGMTRWVTEMKPHDLSHVIAMVALYRPGPMEFIPSYIKRMHGEEPVEYRHEKLAPILEETFGITVYQEQIMYTAMNLGGYTASEADFLRKSVAKKKEKELLKNRETFVKGAKANGIPEEAAELIFADWEAFARYGFPKGHAADYAVISVETAYLKCHYPVEYMTALLSVSKGDSGKVAYYIADCRNTLGIEVLPPDIRSSEWDFSIEDTDEGKPAIRFGLGAIKNVGNGPVETILEARAKEPFSNLTKMAQQLDLRKVGKRALESLIKAGALDGFGQRLAILQVMERLSGISASHFQAEEAGQMSFFGADSGLVQEIELPVVNEEANRREMLNWERELVGLYVSDHPLSYAMEDLKGVFTHFSSQLSQLNHGDHVRVVGLVNRLRKHYTKKGDEMAFVGIEDTQGVMDLVVFPRTWTQYRDLIEFDKVVVVDGKLDTQQGDAKILVDKVRTQIEMVESANKNEPDPSPRKPTVLVKKDERSAKKADAKPALKAAPAPKAAPVIAEEPADYDLPDDMPPPPEPFPEAWEEEYTRLAEAPPARNGAAKPAANGVKKPEPEPQKTKEPAQPDKMAEARAKTEQPAKPVEPKKEPVAVMPEKEEEPVMAAENKEKPLEQKEKKASPPPAASAPQVNPAPVFEPADVSGPPPFPVTRQMAGMLEESDAPARMITVVMRSTGDKARDILRMRRVHGMLISYPGRDQFALYIIERSRGYRLEFPNDNTQINDELRSRLEQVVGKDNIKIEPITIQ